MSGSTAPTTDPSSTSPASGDEATTRERILAVAEEMASTTPWSTITMASVGRAAGVSRQTVYNEFGTKVGLGEQVALQVAVRLLQEVEQELDRHDDLTAALAAAIELALRRADEAPLVEAVLTGARGDDESLLPFLTTRSGPILELATLTVGRFVLERWPRLDAAVVDVLAEAAVRLIVSHIFQPSADPAVVGRTTAWMLARAAGEADDTSVPPA